MAPRSQQVVIGKVEFEKAKKPPPLVCVEPAHIPIEGILPTRALTRVECSTGEKPPMTSQTDQMVTKSHNTRAYAMLANFSDQTLTVPKSTVLGITEDMSELLVEKINQGKETNANLSQKPKRKKKNEALYNKLLNGKLDHLNRKTRNLLNRY
jgi:hypothetical protein